MIIMGNIDISHILKARDVFERCRTNLKTEQDKMGATQAFEFCFELCWKMMKRVLETRGLTVGSPKDTFRKAVHEELIANPEIWFDFQEMRNLTVHTYNKESLEEVIAIFETFSKEMDKFILKLRNLE